MLFNEVLYEVSGRVARITFNRPEKRNALDQNSFKAILAYLEQARTDDAVWVISISGKGAVFTAGHDINDLKRGGEQIDVEQIYKSMRRTYKPIVAAINGLALGAGSGIALNADVRFMARSARMGWSQVKIGIASVSGPTVLGRLVPPNIALELMFTGDYVTSDRAHELGLVNHVVEDDALSSEVDTFIQRLLANGPLAMRAMKEVLLHTLDLPATEAIDYGQAMLAKVKQTRDAQEGLQAFLEKRAPIWSCT